MFEEKLKVGQKPKFTNERAKVLIDEIYQQSGLR
jgi:hypothetical protein